MKIFTVRLLRLALVKKQRHFFRAGASSGTIAKAMSAYDKDLVMLFMVWKTMDDM